MVHQFNTIKRNIANAKLDSHLYYAIAPQEYQGIDSRKT